MSQHDNATSSPPRRTSGKNPGWGGINLGSVFGIRLRVDFSLAIIFALVAVNLGTGVIPGWHPQWSSLLVWAVSLAAALLFFASILVHELSHAIVGRAVGIPVNSITLFIFGGMAHMEGEPPNAKAEFLMAGVGPLTSLAIGVGATLAGVALGPSMQLVADDPVKYFGQLGPVSTLLLWLGPINVALAIFNLVPGFPLDGGRVLRAILWAVTNDLKTATLWASRGGQAVAWGLIAWGVFQALGGGLLQGFWLIIIGFFLNAAARASFTQMVVHDALKNVTTGELMFRHFDTVPPDASVDELVHRHLLTSDQRCFPVGQHDSLEGIVCREDVRRADRSEWTEKRARDVMTPASQVETISPDTPAVTALRLLGARNVDQLPVLDGGRLVGLVRRQDIVRWLTLYGEDESDSTAPV